MKAKYIFISIIFANCLLLPIFIGTNALAQNTIGSAEAQTRESLRASGMMFTENKGQFVDMNRKSRPDILFKGSGAGADVYLRKTGISYVMSNTGEVTQQVNKQIEELESTGIIQKINEREARGKLMQKQLLKIHRVDVDFVNCNLNTEIQGGEQVEGYTNYYYPHCPDGISHVNSYNQVTVKNIYNNIDVKYYGGKEKGLKYDIIVNPGADPSQIKLKYSGADGIEIKNDEPACRNGGQATAGRLIIKNSIGEIVEKMPKVYQNINGEIVDVKAYYVVNGTTVNLKLETWNPLFPLVVDPWVSYYGGSLPDRGGDVATDNTGNVVFTGQAQSLNFPVAAGHQMAYGGNTDAFVVKMNVNGGLLWATYYGGTNTDSGEGIITDASGNIFVSGTTSSNNFPVQSAHQPAYGGGTGGSPDAFLFKLDPAGVRIWATYYGGTGYDGETDVASDGNNVYLYGTTFSLNAISTAAAFQTAHAGGAADCFVVKFLTTGVRVWGTYIGGSADDLSGGISCDTSGDIVIGGGTKSTNFPIGFSGANVVYQNTLGGAGGNAFVFKFDPAGLRLWSTYFGGAIGDNGVSIATDGLNNVIIAGTTVSTTGIAFNGTTQMTFGGAVDNFIAKFNSTGLALWGTYLGGSSSEYFGFVATDANNNIYFMGEWEEMPPSALASTTCAYQPNPGGGSDARLSEDQFVAKYTPNGIQICLTYLGGPGEDDLDMGGGITVKGNYLYLTGGAAENYPVTPGAFQTIFGGPTPASQAGDAFIAQLCINICEPKALNPDFSVPKICPNTPVVFNSKVNNSCDTTNYKYQWTFTGGTPGSSTLRNPSVTFSTPGFYSGKLVVTTPCQKDSITNTIIVNPCSIDATVTGATICPGSCTNLTVTGLTGTSPYTYSWSTGATTQTINVCPSATTSYTVIITDANGLTFAAVPIVIVRATMTATYTSSNIFNCSIGGGGASVLVSNPSGLGTLTYSWSSGEKTSSISPSIAGSYTVTVTDGFGCSITNAFTIIDTRPPAIATFTFSAPCVGIPVNFTHTGTTGSGVTYNWVISPITPANVSGTTTDFSYTFLTAGTYTISHTVTNTCAKTEYVTIVVTNCGSGPTVTATGTSVCPASCATVTSSGTGGSTPFTYLWNTGATTQYINPCPASTTTYTVTITDTGGNTSTSTAVVTVNPIVTVTTTATNITCNGIPNGSVIANPGSGTPGFTYNWSNGGTTSQISNLPAGQAGLTSQIYTVTVTDSKGCTAISTAAIASPPPLAGQFTKGTASCNACGCKQWIMVNASGGTSPYSYTWSASGGIVNRYRNNLCPGTYTIKVTDKNNCSTNITLTAP